MNIIQRGILYVIRKGWLDNMDDESFLKLRYWCRFSKRLNLKNPKAYTEKLQWMKLYDRNPEYIKMVDKYEAKKYVADRIGEEHIIKTLGVWDRVEDIDYSMLPNQFVLKCTHDSGGIVICKDKRKLNVEEANRKLKKGLEADYYAQNREWPYKGVKRRIIAEEYMVDESGTELKDYKIFCFNGEPKALFVGSNRGVDTRFDFFDMEYNHLPIINGHPVADSTPAKPKGFDEMKELAKKLSAGIPHVRVDFYDVNGKVYFGELTFCHWSGFTPFEPEEWDYKFGEWLELPVKGK